MTPPKERPSRPVSLRSEVDADRTEVTATKSLFDSLNWLMEQGLIPHKDMVLDGSTLVMWDPNGAEVTFTATLTREADK